MSNFIKDHFNRLINNTWIRHNYHMIIIFIFIGIAIYYIHQNQCQFKRQVLLDQETERKNIILRKKLTNIKNQYYQQIQQKQLIINKKLQPIIRYGSQHQPNIYESSLDHHNNINNDEIKRQELVESYLSMKELYYNGIPDKYDNSGFKIKGIPPNPQLAIDYLNLAIKNGYLKGWVELGQMYHYGFYDFPSNLTEAKKIYLYIINNINDQQIINESRGLYQEAFDESENIQTHSWLNLPYTTRIQPKKTLYEIGQNKKNTSANKIANIFNLAGIMRMDGDDATNQPININNIFRTLRNDNIQVAIANNVTVTDGDGTEGNQRKRNDMHNVHDHSVIATIKQSVEKLRKDTVISKNPDQCMSEIRQYLEQLPNNDKKGDAILALDAVERNYMPLSFTDLKETDALALVWNRIHSDKHKDNTKVLKENLADELSECIEHSKPVCATGRFTRILDTLNAIDEAVNVRPTYAINEEMMDKAVKIREEGYNKLTDEEKKQVDNIQKSDFQKQWTENLRDEIKKQLSETYVKSDILTETTFESEIKQWINEI